MKTLILIFVLSLVQLSKAEDLILPVGEVRPLRVNSNGEIRVSSSKVIRVLGLAPDLRIIGRAPGEAALSTSQLVYRVNILTPATYQLYRQVLTWTWLRGLKFEVRKGQLLVKGTLLRMSDWLRLRDLQIETQGEYRFLAKVDRVARAEVQRHLENWSQNTFLGPHRIQLDSQVRFLASAIDERTDSPSVARLSEWGLTTERVQALAAQNLNLRLTLTFAELANGASRNLGLDWTDGQTVTVGGKIQGPDEFRQKLRFLKDQGTMKVLAEPVLNLSLNAETEFLAGGEFAVRSRDHRSQSVQWKRHGLILRVKPIAKNQNEVLINFDTELSLPDYSQTVDGVPSLRSTRTSTQASLALGSTLVLSELQRVLQSQTQLGVQGLEDIPLLGLLFKSRSFQENKSSFYLFATLNEGDSSHDERKKKSIQVKAQESSND